MLEVVIEEVYIYININECLYCDATFVDCFANIPVQKNYINKNECLYVCPLCTPNCDLVMSQAVRNTTDCGYDLYKYLFYRDKLLCFLT